MATPPSKLRYYTGEGIELSYDAQRCIHVSECLRGLPEVFDRARRPWILPSAASDDAIAEVVARCPSGALHFHRTDGGLPEAPPEHDTIVPMPDGPLYVRGRVRLQLADATLLVEETRLALCRCGQSRNKPYCDNAHRTTKFADPGTVANGGEPVESTDGLAITALANGPLRVQGSFTVQGADGQSRFYATDVELCRCGASSNKPFCDGSHERIGFSSEPPRDDARG